MIASAAASRRYVCGQTIRALSVEQCVCQPLVAVTVFPAPVTCSSPFGGWVYAARS